MCGGLFRNDGWELEKEYMIKSFYVSFYIFVLEKFFRFFYFLFLFLQDELLRDLLTSSLFSNFI